MKPEISLPQLDMFPRYAELGASSRLRFYQYAAKWAAEGVFMLFAVLFMFIGAQFVGMGLLGEYIGRIYNDVRARPRYFIQRVVRQPETASKEEDRS